MTSLAGVAWHALRPFAGGAGVVAVDAMVRRARCGVVSLSYRIDGASAVRVPVPAASSARIDGLWEHTCLEAFVAPVDAAAYWELNLSPSGDWQCYRFDGYRSGMEVEARVERPLRLKVTRDGDVCRLDATVDLTAIPAVAAAAIDVGLSAVIERDDGTRGYWALRHAASQPDFHDRAGFVLRLPPVEAAA